MIEPVGFEVEAESSPNSAGRSTLIVTAGIVVLAISSYGFLTLAARHLDRVEFSALAAMWSLTYAIAGGFFLPLEQEGTRAVAQRLARGERPGAIVMRLVVLGAGLLLVILLALILGRQRIADSVFGGNTALVWELCLASTGIAGLYLTRGLFAGTGAFLRYGGQLAAEGLLRLGMCLAVVLWASSTAGSLGLVVAMAPVAALTLSMFVLPRSAGVHRAARWTEATPNLGYLLIASVVAQGIANAGPIVLQLIGDSDQSLAGRFLAAFVLVRLPLLFTSALQSSFLPRLVHAQEQGDQRRFDAMLRQLVLVVGVLGLLALAGFALVGPQMLSLLFGSGFALGRLDLVVLAASSVLLLLAALLQSAVIALSGHRLVAWAWFVSGITFVLVCLLPVAPLPRLELAYISSGLGVLVLLWWPLRRSQRAVAEPVAR